MGNDEFEYPAEWTEDQVADFKGTVSRILAGFDQVRQELKIDWQEVTWSRMRVLAQRVALLGYDFKVEEAVLIGTWFLGSARHQITEAEAGLPDTVE